MSEELVLKSAKLLRQFEKEAEASVNCRRLVAMYCGQYLEEKINETDGGK